MMMCRNIASQVCGEGLLKRGRSCLASGLLGGGGYRSSRKVTTTALAVQPVLKY